MLVDALVSYGAGPSEATFAVTKRLNTNPRIHEAQQATFWELYDRGSIANEAHAYRRNFNITGLRVLDLKFKKENGQAWDLISDTTGNLHSASLRGTTRTGWWVRHPALRSAF